MAFDLSSLFGTKDQEATQGSRTLVINTHVCPQNHRCPAVAACPVGALSQKGFAAPTVDRAKCTSCGKCSRYCFPGALRMQRA